MSKTSLGLKLHRAKTINADSASAYQEFCKEYNLELNAIPSGFHRTHSFVSVKTKEAISMVWTPFFYK